MLIGNKDRGKYFCQNISCKHKGQRSFNDNELTKVQFDQTNYIRVCPECSTLKKYAEQISNTPETGSGMHRKSGGRVPKSPPFSK